MSGLEDYSYLTFVAQYRNPKTIEHRSRALREFTDWLKTQGIHPLEVGPPDVIRHIDMLRETYAPTTCMARLRSIRAYYAWLEKRGTISRSPVAHIKDEALPRRAPKFVPPEDIRRMLEACTTDRNWAVMSIVAFNSLRISELLACDVSDYQREGGRPILHFSPQAQSRRRPPFVVLAEESALALERQLAGRRAGPLFLTREGKRLERGGAATGIFVLTSERAGLGYKVTPDMMTNALPAAALRQGFSFRGLSRAMGVPDRRHSERWLGAAEGPEEDNASLRFARLVLNPPETSESMLLHVDSLLNESDLPEAFAAMAAGAIFERHLYELCIALNLDVPSERKDGKISKYTHELRRRGVLALAELKLAEGIAEARNNAAHGAFDLLRPGSGRATLRDVRQIVAAHPVPTPQVDDLEVLSTTAANG